MSDESNEKVGQLGQEGIESITGAAREILDEIALDHWPSVVGGASFADRPDGSVCVLFLRTARPRTEGNVVLPADIRVGNGGELVVDGVVVADLNDQTLDALVKLGQSCLHIIAAKARRAEYALEDALRERASEPVVVPATAGAACAEQLADADERVPE